MRECENVRLESEGKRRKGKGVKEGVVQGKNPRRKEGRRKRLDLAQLGSQLPPTWLIGGLKSVHSRTYVCLFIRSEDTILVM